MFITSAEGARSPGSGSDQLAAGHECVRQLAKAFILGWYRCSYRTDVMTGLTGCDMVLREPPENDLRATWEVYHSKQGIGSHKDWR